MKKRTKTIIIIITIVAILLQIAAVGILFYFFRFLYVSSAASSITEFLKTLLYAVSLVAIYFVGFCMEITAENPPEPIVTYAEFPYEIVCQYDGEVYAVNGDYVCEYDGIYSEWANRKLTWNSYVKGTSDDEIILFENDKIIVYCYIGEPAYYLGSPEHTEVPEPELYCKILPEGYVVSEKKNPESFEKVCGAEIVSYELSDPIENTFVSKKWYEFWK